MIKRTTYHRSLVAELGLRYNRTKGKTGEFATSLANGYDSKNVEANIERMSSLTQYKGLKKIKFFISEKYKSIMGKKTFKQRLLEGIDRYKERVSDFQEYRAQSFKDSLTGRATLDDLAGPDKLKQYTKPIKPGFKELPSFERAKLINYANNVSMEFEYSNATQYKNMHTLSRKFQRLLNNIPFEKL